MSFAFELATHDPNTGQKGRIGDRSVYARRFTLSEVTSIQADVQKALKAAVEAGRQFTVKDEIKPVAKALSARVADDGGPITADFLLDTLTEEQYRALMEHYAPSLLGSVGGQGKA